MDYHISAIFLFTLVCLMQRSEGRGRLIDPPARATLWRFGFNTPINYNDNGLSCGGTSILWTVNGGKCGVCGDPYNGRLDNEAGGRYALGIIARNYTEGQMIRVLVEVTANELGWFEFQLCAHNDPRTKVSEECLGNNTLELADGGSRFPVPSTANGVVPVDVKLPENITCTQCVFRWKWNAGNQWGRDPAGYSCLGCGHQEQFYNCADIRISPKGSKASIDPTTSPSTTTTTTSASTSKTTSTTATESTALATTTTTNQSKSSTQKDDCFAVNNWAGEPTLDEWCRINCRMFAYCPAIYCSCDVNDI